MKGKRVHGLHPAAPADEMIRLALGAQLKAMCDLRARALDSDDPEGVHDMRVLSRRLRSAMSDFEPHLRKPKLSVFRVRAIAKRLGVVRDEDVALAALKKLKGRLTGEARDGIELLEQERRKRRDEAFAELEQAISPVAIAVMQREFNTRLRSVTLAGRGRSSSSTDEISQVVPFSSVATAVIERRLKDFRTAARETIYRPAAVADLHELRILAKGLRYAVELFVPLWGKRIKGIAKEVAGMQTSLGELHDCDVWIDDLGARLKRSARTNRPDPVSVGERAAAVQLLRNFIAERTKHYDDALARWEKWESSGLFAKLNELIKQAEAPPLEPSVQSPAHLDDQSSVSSAK